MKKLIKRILVPTFLSVVFFYNPTNVHACGPFFPEVRFSLANRPGEPVERFVGGQIGLIFPGFEERYLELSYELLAGHTYTQTQQDSILSTWNPSEEKKSLEYVPPVIDQWKSMRSKVLSDGSPANIEQYFSGQLHPGEYDEYLNINDDAFIHAAEVLNARIQEFGSNHSAVVEWVHAQDQVFAIGSATGSIPEDCKAQFPLVFQYDRFYQIASAHFYARDFDLAERMFSELSHDPKNPWAKLCRYMISRTLIRKATLASSKRSVFDTLVMEQAKNNLQEIMNDTSMESFRVQAKHLLNFVLFRVDPDELFKELRDKLFACSDNELLNHVNEISPEYDDYQMLSLRGNYRKSPEYLRIRQRIEEARRNVARSEGKKDWIWCFRSDDYLDYEHAMAQWNEFTKSQAWFLCVIAKAQASDPRMIQILEHARSIPPSSPSYPMVQYHRIRLLQELGRIDEARSASNAVLKVLGTSLPNASTNYFLVQRANLSNSLMELLTYGQLLPVGYDYPESKPRSSDVVQYRFLMFELAEINDHVPLQLLTDAVDQGLFEKNLSAEVALAAWVKAVLLKQDFISVRLARKLQSLIPELSEEFRSYITASDTQARRFQGMYMMMKNPGMTPYIPTGYGRSEGVGELSDYRDNWWGRYYISREDEHRSLGELLVVRHPAEFLSEDQRWEAEKEWNLLGECQQSFSIFTSEAVKWAKVHPNDSRSPEVLYLAIRASRYSAAVTSDSSNAKPAFILLHKKYPGSSWAKKAPYWFN